MVKTLIISVLIIAIAVALLSVKLIFKKDGRFSSQHIHDSEAFEREGHSLCDGSKIKLPENKAKLINRKYNKIN